MWRKKLKLNYETWHITHMSLAVAAIVGGVVHMVDWGYYLTSLWKRGLLIGMSVLGWVHEQNHARRCWILVLRKALFRGIAAMKPFSSKTSATRGMAICLAMTAGYLDGYGLLVLGTYVSFMSGNTTLAGVNTGKGHFHAAVPSGLAICFFLLGSFAGDWFIHSRPRHAHRILFAVIGTLVAVVGILSPHNATTFSIGIAMLSTAMGLLNPALSKVGGESVSLTFVTGALNRLGGHLSAAVRGEPLPDTAGKKDSHLTRAGIEASVWAGFFSGAGLSGAMVEHLRTYSLLPPCLILFALALFSRADGATPLPAASKR